ncbi:thioredoxin domain-containing protein [Nocardia cyriacigeorgica]|uniref:DsbA family protein n=1 Tax=Nocardia cyriacigeorgica TaxID=135487 RepID=UPI0013BBECF6|nr:thioredoxin domain-containing protein [Nocardia cyriacigeorgica]NEW39548.1 thioredoxin domain-containing protein [Nocardia cyriacigeorgica]NEW50037.1 thioredoxin domain-containing protein [Nocardia cyriacigeorgica]
MSNKPGRKNPLAAAERADRNRKIAIQVGVAAVLVALVAAIGVGIAMRGSDDEDLGAIPSVIAGNPTATSPGAAPVEAQDPVASTGAIRVGNPDAKVTVRVVADIQCPICKLFEEANGQVLADGVANGTINVEYNIASFLDQMSTTDFSSRSANAAYCVTDTGVDKFQAWLQAMFAQQPPEGGAGLPDEKLIEIAQSVGYTDPSIAQCVTDRKYDKFVQAKSKKLLDEGIEGTPTIFVNGEQVQTREALFTPAGLAPVIAEAAGQ